MFLTFNKKLVLIFVVALPLCGMWQIGNGTYIHAKAILAQVLLETAWAETLKGQKEVKPWPWADTWPISRLNVPSLGISRIVLAGASGSSLAFGPGHLFGSALPGQSGNSVIAGHRDTHFRFLQDLYPDDMITVQTTHSTTQHYRVIETAIINEADTQYLTETHDNTLTLITCFPFDAIVPGGPLRYVVVAKQNIADSTLSI